MIVKVNETFDDHLGFSIFLKPKYHYQLNLINADMWVMIIDDKVKSFKNESGEEIEFYNVILKYITSEKLIDLICKKAFAIHNVEEFDEDEL